MRIIHLTKHHFLKYAVYKEKNIDDFLISWRRVTKYQITLEGFDLKMWNEEVGMMYGRL